jgi:hypothetical protein
MKSAGLSIAVVFVAVLLAGCQNPSSAGLSGNDGSRGSLVLNIGNQVNSRTLAPALDMAPASYAVTGTGPGGATFTRTTTGAAITATALVFGSWQVTVNATNAAGTLVGTGSATVQVNTGATTAATVNVIPVAGTGTLALTVSWPSSQVQTPAVSASLTPATGTAQPLPFTVSGSSATYSNAAVGSGYYTLNLAVTDNSIVVAGAVEVVRMVAGQTTSGTYSFANVNAPGGTIQVNVNANLQNPLAVAINGANATLNQGNTQALTAAVSNFAEAVVYVWYINGVSVGPGAAYTFGATQNPGYYRIDVTAFSADGTRAGSATANTQVVVAPTYAMGATGPGGGLVFYDAGSYATDASGVSFRYMEASPADLGNSQWWNGSIVAVGTGTALGTGRANTAAIVLAQGMGSYAASICKNLTLNGKSDWFLPSKDESYLMYANLKDTGLGGFLSHTYLSSSQSGDYVWVQSFNAASTHLGITSGLFAVRAIRTF